MSATLREEDRRIVDLLLDRTAAVTGDGDAGPVYASADGANGQRVQRVEKLLRLLDLMPDEQAPADLVRRTLQFVDHARHQPASVHSSVPSLFDPHRPMA